MTVDDEEKIIEQIRTGDIERYAVLVDAYKSAVYNLLYRMTGSTGDAEDLSQQVFVRAYLNLEHFDTRHRFFPWLYTIALNLARSFLKKRQSAVAAPMMPHDVAAAVEDPAALFEKQQRSWIVFQHVQRLPLKLREAVVLRFYQELAYDQVADLLDISISAAKMRVNRGIKKLTRQLEADDFFQTDT